MRIDASLDQDGAQRLRHVFIGDRDDIVGRLHRIDTHGRRQPRHRLLGGGNIERHAATQKGVGLDAA